jgi:hypothetical protein
MAEPDLSVLLAHLDARQQLRGRRPWDAPLRLVSLPEPSGVPLEPQAVPQALLDAQVSGWAQVRQALRRLVLRQAREQAPWEQSWVRQALPSAQPLLVEL